MKILKYLGIGIFLACFSPFTIAQGQGGNPDITVTIEPYTPDQTPPPFSWRIEDKPGANAAASGMNVNGSRQNKNVKNQEPQIMLKQQH